MFGGVSLIDDFLWSINSVGIGLTNVTIASVVRNTDAHCLEIFVNLESPFPLSTSMLQSWQGGAMPAAPAAPPSKKRQKPDLEDVKKRGKSSKTKV